MRSRFLYHLAAFTAVLVTSGCNFDNSTPKLNEKIDGLTTKLGDTINKIGETDAKITDVDRQIKATQSDIIEKLKLDKTKAAQFVFGATAATNSNNQPNAYTHHTQTELLRATSILGMPSQEDINEANARLQLELSQKESDHAELVRRYEEKDREIALMQKNYDETVAHLRDTEGRRDQLSGEKDQLTTQVTKQSQDLDQEHRRLEAKQQDELNRIEATNALKKQLMVYLTIAGIVSGLGAAAAFRFYPPVMLPLGVASAGFFIAGYLVTQINKWELLGILAVAGLAVAAAAYIKYRRTNEIASNSIGATQELKNRALDGDPSAVRAYGELRKHLVEWFGESGHYLEDEIQKRLQSMNVVGKKPLPSLVPKIEQQQKADADKAIAALAPDTVAGLLKSFIEKQKATTGS